MRSSFYERKELVLLGILSILLVLLSFSFGVHVGKRAPQKRSEIEPEVADSGSSQSETVVALSTSESPASVPAESIEVSNSLSVALRRMAPKQPFCLQVLAVPISDLGSVEKDLSQLERVGLTPWVRRVDLPGKGSWYRVYLGGFSTRIDAETQGQNWRQLGRIKGFLVTKNQESSVESSSAEVD